MKEPHETRIIERSLSYFDDRAGGLVEVVRDQLPQALDQVRAWHPSLANISDDTALAASFSRDDARLVYARQHGFESWSALAEYLLTIPADASGEPFLAAFEAVKRGDLPRVAEIIRAHPDILQARGTNGNTLLNLASYLTPYTPAALQDTIAANDSRLVAVRMLLDAGADVTIANERGWTPLHQAAYRNDPQMVALYINAGAPTDVSAHGAGGTPLAVAAFWGHREAVDVIAKSGVEPANLRLAASTGNAALIDACFDASGTLTQAARSNRAFYRPHSGFPKWSPTDSTQEVIDEAFIWAAKNDRTHALSTLLKRGANIDADVYRGTALAWAAANNRVGVVTWLLDHGANINGLSTFGGLSHGSNVTALHLAAQNNHHSTVRALVQRGADTTIRDGLYGGTPRGWAEHSSASDALAELAG